MKLIFILLLQNYLGKQTVTFPEFLKMLAGQKAKSVNIEKEVLGAFILSDKSKKGYISRGDLEHLLMRGGEGMTRAKGLYLGTDPL